MDPGRSQWVDALTRAEPPPSPQPEQENLGFGFDVCEVSQLQGQFDGLDATDTAYVVIERDGGECPSVQSASAHVGIDLDADGFVDASHGPIACEVYYCRTFAAPDLDKSGTQELLVVESAGSITGLGLYTLDDSASGGHEVVRVVIGVPDMPAAGFVSGQPARLLIGGDEGWSYRLRCEDHGNDGQRRYLYASRAFREVDGDGPVVIHETTLVYSSGDWGPPHHPEPRLPVHDAADREAPASDDPLGPQPTELCGTPIPAI